MKSHRFHLILDCILETYKKAQKPGALRHSAITLGKYRRVVNLYVPLQFIIGDVEGGDQLCGRKGGRGMTCLRLCRTCDVSTACAANVNIVCNRICVADIRQLYVRQDLAELDALEQRPTYNCFYDIDCGKDPYGIFSMIHTEGLHALEVGIMKYMVEILFEDLSKPQQAHLDRMVKEMTTHPKQHSYCGFPRLLWSDGVSTLTFLTGDQRVGKLFAILLVAMTREGEEFFSQNLNGGVTTWKRLVYCFQQILCYWAWLKQDHYWMADDIAACHAATQSIKTMMRQLQTLWPRKAGLRWFLTKIHEQFHVPLDIHRHGCHTNVHSAPQEHNHLLVKQAAKKTQMHKHTIDLQTGERIVDRIIVQWVYDRMNKTLCTLDAATDVDTPKESDDGFTMATKGHVVMIQDQTPNHNKRQKHDIMGGITWKPSRKNIVVDKVLHQSHVLAFLIQRFFNDYGHVAVDNDGIPQRILKLRCYTEYQRNGIVYRCHPNYRGAHAYYDWCYVKWHDGFDEVTQEEKHINIIGRVHLFIETPDGEMRAVVQSLQYGTDEEYSVFGTYWYLEQEGPTLNQRPKFELADVDALGDHAMVVPYTHGDKRHIHIHNRSEWLRYFQNAEPPPDH